MTWRTSSYSFAERNCVQVLRLPGEIAVRDSPRGGALRFTLAEWAQFTASVKRGETCPLPPPASTGRLGFPDGPLDLPPLPRRLRAPFIDENPPI